MDTESCKTGKIQVFTEKRPGKSLDCINPKIMKRREPKGEKPPKRFKTKGKKTCRISAIMQVTVQDGGKAGAKTGVKLAYKHAFAPVFTSDGHPMLLVRPGRTRRCAVLNSYIPQNKKAGRFCSPSFSSFFLAFYLSA